MGSDRTDGRGALQVTPYTSGVADYLAPEYHPAFEEYCETIFELHEDDVDVIQARIAERLGVSRPAVSEMIHRLQEQELVEVDKAIRLTPAGVRLAERVVRRHRLAERFLTDMLGLSWAEAHREAGKWEHIISDSVEQAIVRVLGNPTTCPHGNPIPGTDYHAPDTVTLTDLRPGASFVVSRIPEELEFAPGLLDFLEENAILPGRAGTLTVSSPDGTTTVEIDGRHVGRRPVRQQPHPGDVPTLTATGARVARPRGRPDQSSSRAATLLSTRPRGSATSRMSFSLMSLTWPPALRGQATHSPPAGNTTWPSGARSRCNVASVRKKATTTSGATERVTGTRRVACTVTPSGRSGTAQPGGGATSTTSLPALMPSFFASGVPEYPAATGADPTRTPPRRRSPFCVRKPSLSDGFRT